MTNFDKNKSDNDKMSKFPKSYTHVNNKQVNHSNSESTDVWFGRNLFNYTLAGGLIGLITHRRCLLELRGKRISLKRGNNYIFNSPIQNAKISSLPRNFGGLKITIDGKAYSVLFFRPFYPILSDLRVKKTTEWQQILVSSGAIDE
ncbi:MAG: hypothetical protein ABSB12_03610 [Candidatus Saccharimonadales bacterium]|jgi:hypothetical protein